MLKALLVLLFFLGNVFCPEKDVAVDTVCYDTQAGYPLHLYVIRPADADTLLPCVLYVPGSAWKKQGMRLHASDFGVDTDNFFAWGSSSGAHVFLLQALT